MHAKLIHWGSEEHILYIARVSSNQENADPKLLSYLIRQSHWSPFEMVGACVEINTTRDIGRQILRHRSFSFQEFSGRYAEYADLRSDRQLRFKGTTNRQGSRVALTEDEEFAKKEFDVELLKLSRHTAALYRQMLEKGIAPECARAVLPEGMVPTRMYMNGTLRSWIHYLKERLALNKDGVKVAQAEHVWIAEDIYDLLKDKFPTVWAALESINYTARYEG